MKRIAGILLACCLALESTVLSLAGTASAPAGVPSVQESEAREAPRAPSLHAQSAVLMDGDSGRVLFEKEGSAVRPMASTTKIMTCILALERGDMDDQVEASAAAAAQP